MPGKISSKRLRQLLRDMVDIYSPTGKESELTDFLASYLHDNNLPVTMREVSDGRRNIEVIPGKNPPDIAFIGHIDTVPAFDIEDYQYFEEDGTVFGLGTADMKGGCAAMIEAFISLTEADYDIENAGLFLVVGEEETGDGTAALLDAMTFPWAIVAEPTNLVPCLGHYGYIEMLIRATGRRRHASMANLEYNATFSTLQTLMALAELVKSQDSKAIMNIRSVNSSESGFAVPASCEAWLDLHIKPSQNIKEFVKTLRVLAEKHLADRSINSHEIEFPTIAPGYQLDSNSEFCDILKKACAKQSLSWRPGVFTSHSDANLLRQANCDPVILGPGTLARAHTRDEAVSFEQVLSAAKLYKEILQQS